MPASIEPTTPRYLGPRTDRVAVQRLRSAGATVVELTRRGIRHGFVALDAEAVQPTADPEQAWRQAAPVFVPGAVGAYLEPAAELIAASRAMFEELRAGQRFLDLVAARMLDTESFDPAGCTVDRHDAREIEKVFVHAVDGRDVLARDLFAKLSWIADDDSDLSLRIRFSCGAEQLDEWVGDAKRAEYADRFAAQVFPECAIVSENAELLAALGELCRRPVRCSERIVYSNAPGGGAVFHHDADPGQLGVIYTQLAGSTAWLAAPARVLAEVVADLAPAHGLPELRDADAALAALRGVQGSEPLWTLLNRVPAFTERLVERGAFHFLRAGDVLLLPSNGPDDVAWHSVFAAGRRPSLAHSYGLFPARVPGESP